LRASRPLSAVLLADLDGTLLPYGSPRLPGEAAEALRELEGLGVEVVPVTAKSAAEVWRLWVDALGSPPRFAVVESGGAIYASPGLLSRATGVERVEGFTVEVLELAPRIEEWRGILEEALRASGCTGFKTLTRAPPSVAREITLLAGRPAALAAERRYLEVVYHPRGECLDSAAREAVARGLYAFRSRRLLHLAMHAGKGRAVAELLGEPALRGAGLVAAAGDSPADAEIIEAADEAFLVAPKGRPWLRGLPKPYHPVTEEPPAAARSIAEILKLRLKPPTL